MNKPPEGSGLDVQALWAKYEDIAMHFNDLLMRLRSQSLAGIAAISTFVGIFTKGGSDDIRTDWLIATCIFTAAAMFWMAIWCLDILYYNRLLFGAVTALRQIEKETRDKTPTTGINISTLIEAEFRKPLTLAYVFRVQGVTLFYLIVLVAVVSGALISLDMYLKTPPVHTVPSYIWPV